MRTQENWDLEKRLYKVEPTRLGEIDETMHEKGVMYQTGTRVPSTCHCLPKCAGDYSVRAILRAHECLTKYLKGCIRVGILDASLSARQLSNTP